MFKAIKKVWGAIKSMYNKATTLEYVETHVVVMEDNRVQHQKSQRNWAEYAECLREQDRVERWVLRQERIRERLDEANIRAWRENNARLNEVLPKIRQTVSI